MDVAHVVAKANVAIRFWNVGEGETIGGGENGERKLSDASSSCGLCGCGDALKRVKQRTTAWRISARGEEV